jgi:hypothetical protein
LAPCAHVDDGRPEKRSNSAPPDGGAIDAGSWPAVQLLWLLYRNRAGRRGICTQALVRSRVGA